MTLRDEAHAARLGSVFTLALQLVNTIGLAIVLIAIYQFGEWKGTVDTRLDTFKNFMDGGDRYPADRGAAAEARIGTLEQTHRADIKDLRQEILTELRELRKAVEGRQ